MKIKLALIVISCLTLFVLGACRKSTTNQNTNRNSSAAAPEMSGGGVAPTGDRYYFRGTISDKLKIEITLLRDGTRLTGSYFYPKVGKDIGLEGSIDNGGNFNLQEKDEAGQQTGIFKGKWTQTSNPNESGLSKLQGKWSKPDGSKETTFEATQQPVETSSAVRITPKLIKETNKASHYVIDMEYPQIDGDPRFDKFNRETRAMITREVAAFKTSATATEAESGNDVPEEASNSTLDCSFEFRLLTDDLISVQFSESDYGAGAAHPNSYSTVLNYDVKNGKRLVLPDLFNAKSNYLKVLSDYCIKDLKHQSKENDALPEDMIQSGASARADNYQKWTITSKGLWMIFDPYQVGPYAAGPQFVLVPYTVLKDVIKSDGPLGRLVTSA